MIRHVSSVQMKYSSLPEKRLVRPSRGIPQQEPLSFFMFGGI